MKIKSIIVVLFVALLGLIAFVPKANAQEVRRQDNLTVAKNETISSALVANGSTINIEGNIDGDLYCFGSQVVISGRVNGDVFCAAQSISVSGRVNGSVRLAANDVNISGTTSGSALIVSSNFILGDKASIGNDLTVASSSTRINGAVGRDLVLYSADASLNGYVGRNVSGRINHITIGSNADVRGKITYSGQNDPIRMSGSKVSGEIVRTPVMSTASYGSGVLAAIVSFLIFMVSLLLVSLATVWAFPTFYSNTNKQIESGIGKTSLFGLANLFLVPVLALILLTTLIGVPLAGLILVAWVLSLILCGPVFAYYIGSKIFKKGKNSKNQTLIMLVGSVIVLALYAVPVVNLIVGAVVAIVGSGAIMAHFKYSNYKPKQAK